MLSSQGSSLQRFANRLGVLALVLLILPAPLAALIYRGEAGELFSFLNHSLSELGRYGSSPLALLVNGGLFFGGLALLLSLLCYGRLGQLRGQRHLVWLGGVLAMVFSAFGLFPVNVGYVHVLVFTHGYMVIVFTMLLYCATATLLSPPRWGVVPAVLAMVCAASLLLRPDRELSLMDRYPFGLFGEVRPLIWWPALLGWALMISLVAWVAFALWRLAHANTRAQGQ